MKEQGFVQDERDPCLFIDVVRDICTRVHVDDMLAVAPKDATRQLLQELAKDMEMRWDMVAEKRQEFMGRSLSRTTKGFILGLAEDYVKQLCTDFGFGELEGANILVCRETPQR